MRALLAATAISACALGSLMTWPASAQEPATASAETGDAGETATPIALLTAEEVDSFKADPASFLANYLDPADPAALAALQSEVASLARTDPSTAAALIDLARTAGGELQNAIAQGLADAAAELQTADPAAAQTIQTAVAASGLQTFAQTFSQAIGDVATAATNGEETPGGEQTGGQAETGGGTQPGGAPGGGIGGETAGGGAVGATGSIGGEGASTGGGGTGEGLGPGSAGGSPNTGGSAGGTGTTRSTGSDPANGSTTSDSSFTEDSDDEFETSPTT